MNDNKPDIVECLRALHREQGYPFAAEAADEIERLRAQWEHWKEKCHTMERERNEWAEWARAAEVEVKRLRRLDGE